MSAIYREDRKWWYVAFTFPLPDGTKKVVREKSPVNTRLGAERHERQRREELGKSGGAVLLPTETFNDFMPSFLAFAANNTKRSTHVETLTIIKHHLASAFGSMLLDAITSEEIETYKLTACSKRYVSKTTLTRKTINNHLIVLSRILHIAHEWKKLKVLPKIRMFPGVSAADRDFTFLTFEEAERFTCAAGKNLDFYEQVEVALHTGLRISELRALRWLHVDLKGGRILVRERLYNNDTDIPKSGKGREIPLSDTARNALRRIQHLRGPYVFCDAEGKPWTYSACRNAIENISRRAAVGKAITWHDLRHTFASHLVMKGVPLRVVQDLMGHATIEMTLRYAHLAPAVKADAVKMLDRAVQDASTHVA